MKKPYVASLLAGLVLGAAGCSAPSVAPPVSGCECGTIVAVKAQDSAGRPMANVRIFDGYRDPGGVQFLAKSTITDGNGVAEIKDPGLLFGIAPDGRTAYAADGNTLTFGPVGAISVRLLDEARRPIAGRTVRLEPAEEKAPIRTFGVLGETDNQSKPPSNLQGITDSTGRAEFLNLPRGVPFNVTTVISPSHFFRFEGAILPGQYWTGVLSHKCVVRGHVYAANGRPLTGATVQILHLPYIIGVLDGEPDVIASATTDRRGVYRITGLPNCDFGIKALPHGAEEAPTEVVRSPGRRWSSEDSVLIKPGGAICDIRVKRAG